MALHIEGMVRRFVLQGQYGGSSLTLDDPGETLTPAEVQAHYATLYPELTTASVTGPVIKDDVAEYTFGTQAGTKG